MILKYLDFELPLEINNTDLEDALSDIRKGSVIAFITKASYLLDPQTPDATKEQVNTDLKEMIRRSKVFNEVIKSLEIR